MALTCTLLLAVAYSASVYAQSVGDPNPVRFDPTLAQVDATVTDSHGSSVPDLKPEDIRVLQDGKSRKITAFSYVMDTASSHTPRSIVFMVNDSDMAAPNVVRVRDALNRFIDGRLQPGDRIALVNTTGGSGYLRQFTSRRRELHAAVDDLHWRPPLPYALVTTRVVELLRSTIAGLAEVPGRKSLIVLSDDMMPGSFDVRSLADAAARSSVVIHTIDPSATPSARVLENFLNPLSDATAGIVQPGDLDLDSRLRAVMDDQTGYYLVGWDPGPALKQIWGWPVYHRLDIKANRAGLTVRTRGGFFGVSGPLVPAATSSKTEQILVTLSAPLKPQEISVDLTPLFVQRDNELYIRSLIHIGQGIALTEEQGGCYIASLTIYSSPTRLNDQSQGSALSSRAARLRLCGNTLRKVREGGLVCLIEDKVSRSGSYEVSIGVRNGLIAREPSRSGGQNTLIRRTDWKQEMAGLGTASRLVEVPGIGTAMPPFYLRGSEAPKADTPQPQGVQFRTLSSGDPAIRDFHPGDTLIYNAGEHARIRIMRDGEEIDTGEATGSYQLKRSLPAGQYILQVIGAEQWADFRIVI
ncbi:MAG: hypothetical protein JWO80_3590 [Bryobacterales bacterium]|nr:hypothetical protein [Bryobacterales bacterium]